VRRIRLAFSGTVVRKWHSCGPTVVVLQHSTKSFTAIPAVLLDNIASTLGSSSLDAALTGTTWTDRVLGKSETTGTLPLTTVWIATGNNVVLGADTARRALYCRLETLEEHPEDREDFRQRDLLSWVRSHRKRLAVAAVTILRAYFAAGRPDHKLRTWEPDGRNCLGQCAGRSLCLALQTT
jgi:hypothetical protein